jgi:ubiquinone/menaquinone biosynthesis C-methylase UbiE
MQLEDVQSPIDLKNAADALQWANEVNVKRLWRYKIFDYYAEEILKHAPEGHILELGAGPGYLAEHLIRHCPDIQYTAFDFSDAMHALAKRKLIPSELERCRFITGDFKQPQWEEALQSQSSYKPFDVIIIHQALHELRHKRHAPLFHQAVKKMMNPDGCYLVCDHLYAPDAMQNNELYMSVAEHVKAFQDANFKKCTIALEIKGLCVFKCND